MSFILVLFKFKDRTFIETLYLYIIHYYCYHFRLNAKKREKYLVIIRSIGWTLTRNIFN